MDQVDTTLALLGHTLAAEFQDLSDIGSAVRVATRLTLAAVLGGVLGLNRERLGKDAGLRTHMLVAMGAALFVVVPQEAGMALADLCRVMQGVVSGVGLLCAGAIIKHREDEQIVGLTSAASIWTTAAIGMACGLGHALTAMVSLGLAWLVLSVLHHLAARWSQRRQADVEQP